MQQLLVLMTVMMGSWEGLQIGFGVEVSIPHMIYLALSIQRVRPQQ